MASDGDGHPVIGQPVRLRDALRRGDVYGREVEGDLAKTIFLWTQAKNVPPQAAIRAVMGQLVAIILTKTSGLAEARDVGEEVCHELMRRLTEH